MASSAITTTSSTRRASARILATVAPSAGCSGSTTWVMKTNRRIGGQTERAKRRLAAKTMSYPPVRRAFQSAGRPSTSML